LAGRTPKYNYRIRPSLKTDMLLSFDIFNVLLKNSCAWMIFSKGSSCMRISFYSKSNIYAAHFSAYRHSPSTTKQINP